MPATKPAVTSIRATVVCEGLPAHGFAGFDGRKNVRVELQTKAGHDAGRPVNGNAVAFTTEFVVKEASDGALDFAGAAIHGKRGERFLYLSWSGEKAGRREMFRRIKVHLRELTHAQVARAIRNDGVLMARVSATAPDGGPACASVPLLGGGWSVR